MVLAASGRVVTELQGTGPYEGRVIEVSFGKAKAVWAGVLGFVAPGVGVLLPEVAPGGDGVQAREWLWALGLSILFAAGGSTAVYRANNKATAVDKGPA